MRLLLDAHAWIWAVDPTTGTLDPDARALIEDGANEVLFSVASAWEIAIKHGLGKLALPGDPEEFVPDHVSRASMTWLGITPAHALRVATLPPHHDDPFDRLLIAQAIMDNLTVVTSDSRFALYGVEVIPAGKRARRR